MKTFLINSVFILTLSVLTCVSLPAVAQDENKSLPMILAEEFLEGIKKGKVSQAYDKVFEGSGIPTSDPANVAHLKRETSSLQSHYGSIIDYQHLYTEDMGDHLKRIVYIMNLRVHPVIWEFYYYNTTGEWSLINIQFRDNIEVAKKLF